MSVEIVREMPITDAGARQILVRCQEEYFVVSSVHALFTGFETLVFPANEDGEVTDWLEVAGGRGMSREEAISDLEERKGRGALRSW